MQRIVTLIVLVVAFAGCSDSPTNESVDATSGSDFIRNAQKNIALKNQREPDDAISDEIGDSDGAVDQSSGQSDESTSRPQAITSHTVGKLTFDVLPGWVARPKKIGQGIVLFAPENDAWKELGMRPNLSIRIMENPGMKLDDLEKMLAQVMSQNQKTLTAELVEEANSILPSESQLSLDEVDWSQKQSQMGDGYPCLKAKADGVFRVQDRVVFMTTHSIAILDKKHGYTVSFGVPRGFENELLPAWKVFEKSACYQAEDQ